MQAGGKGFESPQLHQNFIFDFARPSQLREMRIGEKAVAAKTSRKSSKVAEKSVVAKPKLISGGNPQIAEANGDAPVQAYISAMPGWKSDDGRRLDGLIVRTVPEVRTAVR